MFLPRMNSAGASHSQQPATSTAGSSGGANASGNAQNQRLKVEDALQYLEEVKQMYGGRPKVYNDFLDIMKEFKSQHLDTCGVITRVAKLFHGKPKLICGFNSFLPNGYRIEIAEDEEEQHQIRLRMPNDEIKIIITEDGTLVDPKQITGIISPGKPAFHHRLPGSNSQLTVGNTSSSTTSLMGASSKSALHNTSSRAMTDSDPVIMYSMVPGGGVDVLNQPGYVRLKHPLDSSNNNMHQLQDPNLPSLGGDYSTGAQIDKLSSYHGIIAQPPTGISPAINSDDGDPARFSNSLFGSLSPNPAVGLPRGGQPFESAIHYVNKIKRRFENDPAIYKRFLDILQQYQGNSKHPSNDAREPVEQRVYREVAALFRHHPDLLEEFTTFMPETAQHHRHAMLVEREKLGKRKYTRRKDRMDLLNNKQISDTKQQNDKDSARMLDSNNLYNSNTVGSNMPLINSKIETDDAWQYPHAGASPTRKQDKASSAARGGRGSRGGSGSVISSGPGSRGGARGGNNKRKLIGGPPVMQPEQQQLPPAARGGRRARGGKTLALNNSTVASSSQQQRNNLPESSKMNSSQGSMRNNSRMGTVDEETEISQEFGKSGARRRNRSGDDGENENENDDDAVGSATASIAPQKKKPKLLKTSFRVKKFVNKNMLRSHGENDPECSFQPLPTQLLPPTLAAATSALNDGTFHLYAFIRRCQRVLPPGLCQAFFKIMELYVARFCDLDFFLHNASQLLVKSYPKLFDQLVRVCERLRTDSTRTDRSAGTPAAHTLELRKGTAAKGRGGALLSRFLESKAGSSSLKVNNLVKSLDEPGSSAFWTGRNAAQSSLSSNTADAIASARNRDNMPTENNAEKNLDTSVLSGNISKKRSLFSISGNAGNEFSKPGTLDPHQRGVPVRRAGQTQLATSEAVGGAEARLMLDPKELKQFGPSYRVLPDDFANLKCSGRLLDPSLKDLLNDRFVSCPVYSEGSGFVISKKNAAEDLLFRVEDERYEMDMLISGAEFAIRDMKWLQERMKCMKPSVLESFRWLQAQNHRRIVILLYGDNGPLIVRSLTEDPQITTPMVLKRLEDKWTDWMKMRKEMQDLWGEQERRNWGRALDYTGQAFKQTDAKRLKSRVLVNEIEKAYDQSQTESISVDNKPQAAAASEEQNSGDMQAERPPKAAGTTASKSPHLELKYRNDEYGLALADDVLFLLEHELERYNFTKKEKRVLRNFLSEIHHRMFGYRPSDVPAHDALVSSRSDSGDAASAPLAQLEQLAQMLLPSDGNAFSVVEQNGPTNRLVSKTNGDDTGSAASPEMSESAAGSTADASTSRPVSGRRNNYDAQNNGDGAGSDDYENESSGGNGGGNGKAKRNGNTLRFGPLSDGTSKHGGAISLSLLGAGCVGSGMLGSSGSGLGSLGAGAELDDLPLHERLPDYHYHSLNRIRTKSDPMLPLPWIELQCIMQDVMPAMNMFEIELSEAAKQRAKYRSRLLAYLRWLTLTNQCLPCFDAVRTTQLTLCGGNHLYALMRYHHTLTERLDILYSRVVRVFEDNNNGDAALLAAASSTSSLTASSAASAMRNDVARLCRVRKPMHPTLYWCVFIDRLMKYTDGNVDVPQFEDDMREMFLDKCQYAFNLALIISYAVKQLHLLYSSESGKKVIESFSKLSVLSPRNSNATTSNGRDNAAVTEKAAEQERITYVNKVQEIMQDNNCYCITSLNNGSKLGVTLLETQVVDEEATTKANTWEDAVSMFLDPDTFASDTTVDSNNAEKKNVAAVAPATLASVKATQPLFLISTHADWGRSKKGRFNDENELGDTGSVSNGAVNDKSAGGADSADEDEDDDDEETTATNAGSALGATSGSGDAEVTKTDGNVPLKSCLKIIRLVAIETPKETAGKNEKTQTVASSDDDEAAVARPKLFVQNARSSRVTESQLQRRETQDRSAALKRFVMSVWMPKAELNRDDDRAFQAKMHEGLVRNKHGSNSETPYFPYLIHRQKDSEERDGLNPSWAPDGDDDDDVSDGASRGDSESQLIRSPDAPPRVRHSPSSPRFKRLASPGTASARKAGLIGGSSRRVLTSAVVAGDAVDSEAAGSLISPFKKPLSRDAITANAGVQNAVAATLMPMNDRSATCASDASTPPGAPALSAATTPPPPILSFGSLNNIEVSGEADEYATLRDRSRKEDDSSKRARRTSGTCRNEDATRREANVTSPNSSSLNESAVSSNHQLPSRPLTKPATLTISRVEVGASVYAAPK